MGDQRNPEGSTCRMTITETMEECGKPAPTHALTLHQIGEDGEAVASERKPICDDHFELVMAQVREAQEAEQ